MDNLPNSIKFIELSRDYDKKIINMPINLQIIKCDINYKFAWDYYNKVKIEFI